MTDIVDDYVWLGEGGDLDLAYCITLVQSLTPDEVIRRIEDLTPADVIRRIGRVEPVTVTGMRRLGEMAGVVRSRLDVDDFGVTHAGPTTGLVFVAVGQVDDWAIIAEANGHLGVLDDVAGPLSRGSVLVSVHYNENVTPQFLLARDGDIQLTFDPSGAAYREGSDPDQLLEVMQRLGFDLSTEQLDPADPGWDYDDKALARAFALAEHVTGIRLTRERLTATPFRCAAVPAPSTMAWLAATPSTSPYTLEELVEGGRRRMAEQANAPLIDELEDVQWRTSAGSEGRGTPKERLSRTGVTGAWLAQHDFDLALALSAADDEQLTAVIRWAREWACTTAELTDKPWFAPVLEHIHRGERIPEMLRPQVMPRLAPPPIAAEFGPDGSLDLGSRQRMVLEDLFNPVDPDPLREACDAVTDAAAVDAGRYTRLVTDLRSAFPRLLP